MEDLTLGTVKSLHAETIRHAGGDDRVIAEAGLHQLVFTANGIPECAERAAFAFWYLCAYPAFREGNFRTACAVAMHILATGGYRVTGPGEELRALARDIAACRTDPEDVAAWLRDNTERSGNGQP